MSVVVPTGAAPQPTRRRRGSGLGPIGTISAVIVAIATLVAIFGSLFASSDYDLTQLSDQFLGPSGGHLLGQDAQGRDVLSRLLVGARSSMLGPLVVVAICVLVGSLLAVVAAWRRGFTDSAISSGLDILFAFPAILLAALAAAVFGPGLWSAVIALSIAYTPYVARILRGAMLRERNQQYVAALEVQGCSATSICLRHIIPNVVSLIVAQGTILFGYAVLDLAAISFLGIGIQAPQPDWGVMISENQSGILQGYPLPALSAGACIVVVVVAMNLLGERLLDRSTAGAAR